jgi:Domain of unknown function (DUF4386)
MDEGSSAKAAGRRAGLVYLILIVFSSGGYATMTWLLGGDLHMVLARLDARHAMFILAFAVMVIGFVVAWVVLAFMLYGLMGSSGQLLGLLMVIFTVAGAGMSLVALSYLVPLLSSPNPGVDAATLAPILRSYNRVLLLAQLFSGLWLFPYGWLVVRSRIAPQFLGWCLFIGGFGYLEAFGTAFELRLNHMMVYRIISAPLGVAAILGEFGMCVWLLIKGVRRPGLAPQGLPRAA